MLGVTKDKVEDLRTQLQEKDDQSWPMLTLLNNFQKWMKDCCM